MFLPGESQGRGNLVGWRLWGHTDSDMTEAMQQLRIIYRSFKIPVYNFLSVSLEKSPWSSKCILQTSSISTSQNLLEMQITVLHPSFLSQETPGMAQQSDLCFKKTPDISDSVAAQV